jgi:hypothetical protein
MRLFEKSQQKNRPCRGEKPDGAVFLRLVGPERPGLIPICPATMSLSALAVDT